MQRTAGITTLTLAVLILMAAVSASLWDIGIVTGRAPLRIQGLPSLVAAALLIFSTPLYYRERGDRYPKKPRTLLRTIHVVIVGVCLALGSIMMPLSAVHEAKFNLPNPYLLIAILAVFSLVVLLKLVRLHRKAERYPDNHLQFSGPSKPEESDVLPSRATALKQLDQSLNSGPNAPAEMIQLQAHWGDGKTFLLSRIEAMARQPPISRAVVMVNSWGDETEHDLHGAIANRILSHRAYMLPYGWLRWPVLPAIWSKLRGMRINAALRGQGAEVGLDMPLAPPPLPWQHTVEVAVNRARRRRLRTIIVFDELDRADPKTVQSILTISQRGLMLPGVTILLSYVEEVTRYKAFNPLAPQLPELASTTEALLWKTLVEEHPSVFLASAQPPTSLQASHFWSEAAALHGGFEHRHTSSPGELTANPTLDWSTRIAWMPVALRLAYASLPIYSQAAIQKELAARYLKTKRVDILPATVEDLVAMLSIFDDCNESIRSAEIAIGSLTTEFRRMLDAWMNSPSNPHYPDWRPPSIRNLREVISRTLRSAIDRGLCDETELAYLMVLAIDRVTLEAVVGSPGNSASVM